jgi:hypothetical protein
MEGQNKDTADAAILKDYHEQVAANNALSDEQRAKNVEEDEDEYFEEM